MKKILYIIVFWILGIAVYAQRMPVSVTTILTPPYTTSLSAMAESGSTRLMVNLLVNDLTVSELPVKLHIKMESAGITIESLATQAVSPLFVGGGEAMVLTGDDLAQSLRLDNLSFKGLSKSAYLKSGHLPAGLWKFSVSVRHYYTNKTISNVGTVTAWITTYQPPELVYPRENAHEPSNISLPLTFSWQPSKHTGGTDALMYRLELWERRVDGVPAQAVVAAVPPMYMTETAGTTVSIPQAALALEPGMRYCWRVTAYDPAGMVTIENKGESDVRTFQYLDKCPEVCGVTIEQEDIYGRGKWEMDLRHVGGYNVEIYDDGGTYRETLWGGMNYTAKMGGDHGNTWHVRVQGICKNNVESEWSEWADFKVPEAFKPLTDENGKPYECGEFSERRKITNFELRETLAKGDTLENERGTTKYIIHTAVKNEDGTFRGLSYAKLSIWGVKILGEYDHLKVNTDGVMLGAFTWRSVKSDMLAVDPEAMEAWADELALNIAGATYNSSIKDTVKIDHGVSFETIEREGNRYYAVTIDGKREEITSMINGERRVLVKDEKGHELVIDKDGDVMGVEEYKSCGGSSLLLRENMRDKDSRMAKSGNVYFEQEGDCYLFDTYNTYRTHKASQGYAKHFSTIGEGDYRPAYACTESNGKIELRTKQYKNITFKNEMGVPVLCREGVLEVTARGDRDTTSVYAYDYDGNIVGKVNVMSYDKLTRKVCLVPVGDVKVPDAATIEARLDEQFAQLMVDFEVTVADRIDITYANGKNFVHGGSGVIGVYNDDQKSAISKLKETIAIDDETCYLFMVKDCIAKKADDSDEVVSGYMPRGYQFGFIYNELTNSRTIAHELCHGAFHLEHTFAAGAEYIAPEGTTDNLMDYNGGETLNHWQWQDIHLPKSVRFKWAQSEGGSEYVEESPICEVVRFINTIRCAKTSGADIAQSYHAYNGYSVNVGKLLSLIDNQDGTSSLVSDDFKTATLNVYIDEGMFSTAHDMYLGYHNFSIAANDTIRTTSPAKLTFTANGKPIIFSISANGSTPLTVQNEILDWIERIIAEPIKSYRYNNKFDISTLFGLSDCQLEQIGIDDRKTLIKTTLSNVETALGLDRDTYQYLLVNLLNSTPQTDVKELVSYLTTICGDIENTYSVLSFSAQKVYFQALCKLAIKYWESVYQNDVYKLILGSKIIGETEDGEPLYGACGGFYNEVGIYKFGYYLWLSNDGFFAQTAGEMRDVYEVSAFTPIECEIIENNAVVQTVTYPAIIAKLLSQEIAESNRKEFINLSLSLALPTLNSAKVGAESISLFNKLCTTGKTLTSKVLYGCTQLGYKIKTTSEAVVLSTKFNVEIARFDATGALLTKVESATTNASHILTFDIDLAYTTTANASKTGRIELAQTAEGKLILREVGAVVKYADRLTGSLKTTYSQLISKGLKYTDDGTSIRFLNATGDELLRIVDDKFVVKKWGAHYLGTIEKELDNGYWLIKNADGTYSIDLGFKEGRILDAKKVNEYHKSLGNDEPYRQGSPVIEHSLEPGDKVYIVEYKYDKKNNIIEQPGGWGSKNEISTKAELRKYLAVKEEYKSSLSELVVREYTVKSKLRVRDGVVGPLQETFTKGHSEIYIGGGQQYEFIDNLRSGEWRNFLIIKDKQGVTLK